MEYGTLRQPPHRVCSPQNLAGNEDHLGVATAKRPLLQRGRALKLLVLVASYLLRPGFTGCALRVRSRRVAAEPLHCGTVHWFMELLRDADSVCNVVWIDVRQTWYWVQCQCQWAGGCARPCMLHAEASEADGPSARLPSPSHSPAARRHPGRSGTG